MKRNFQGTVFQSIQLSCAAFQSAACCNPLVSWRHACLGRVHGLSNHVIFSLLNSCPNKSQTWYNTMHSIHWFLATSHGHYVMLALAGLFQILSSPHVLTWLAQIRSNCPGPIWPSPDTSARWNWLFLRCAIRYFAAIAVAWLHRDSSRFLQLSLHNKDIWVPRSFKPLNLQ